MKKLRKKAAFETINAGMLAFLTFVLVVLLTILLISTVKETDLVCDAHYSDGACYDCTNENFTRFNSSDNYCYNSSGTNRLAATGAGTRAYNGTLDLQEAANLPPQFAQIIVIALVIVGILGMLGVIGYGAYQRIKR